MWPALCEEPPWAYVEHIPTTSRHQMLKPLETTVAMPILLVTPWGRWERVSLGQATEEASVSHPAVAKRDEETDSFEASPSYLQMVTNPRLSR